MLADSDDSNVVDKSTSYILRDEIPNTTNLLEVEQSRYYQSSRSYLRNEFKLPAKYKQSTRPQSKRFIRPKDQTVKDIQIVEQIVKQPTNQQVESDDPSKFNLDIPDELYSMVEGKQVFRLFNHIEHVKDPIKNRSMNGTNRSTINQSTYNESTVDQEELKNNQPSINITTNDSINKNHSTIHKINGHSKNNSTSSSKENFRLNTLPDESRFCNFLNYTKFDTLVENDHLSDLSDGEDEFRTLTRSNNQINSRIHQRKSNTISLNNTFIDPTRSTNCLKKFSNDRSGLTSELMNCEIDRLNDESRYMSIDNTKENDLSKLNSITNSTKSNHSRFVDHQVDKTLTTDPTRNLQKNSSTISLYGIDQTINHQSFDKQQTFQNTNHQSIQQRSTMSNSNATVSSLNKSDVDKSLFRDFSENMAKLNETQPSYLKSLRQSMNVSKQFPQLNDDLSMNFSPIKLANNAKDKFFKTPFKRPFPRSTNLASVREEDDVNKSEFLGKDKLQSTFVEREASDRSRLNEEEIRLNVEKELQNLKLRNEQSVGSNELSNLTRKMLQSKINNGLPIERLDKSNNRTSALLEKTRSKIEEYKRQQLEKAQLSEKTANDVTPPNIQSKQISKANPNDQSVQKDDSKKTYTIEDSRFFDTNFMMSNMMNQTEPIDQSKLDNEKFRLIEERLRRVEQSSIRNSKEYSQSTQSLKETAVTPKLVDQSKRPSSISRTGDILSSEDSNDRTLVNMTNQTYISKYSSLEDQKTYLKFLNTQMIKIKDLEDKSKLIKRREEAKTNSSSSDQAVENSVRNHSISPKSTETSDSLKSLSLDTISPSSIGDQMMNLDSILESCLSNDSSDGLSSIDGQKVDDRSDGKIRPKRISVNKLLSRISKSDTTSKLFRKKQADSQNPSENSFHCKCCRKNKSNSANKHVQTQDDDVSADPNKNGSNQKQAEKYKKFTAHRTDQSDLQQENRRINRKQTYNKLDLLIRSNNDKSTHRTHNRSIDEQSEAEDSFDWNNQSLDEIFRTKCPMYNNIEFRRNLIMKKILKRKELERMKQYEADKALVKSRQVKNLKSTKQITGSISRTNKARSICNDSQIRKSVLKT